MASATFGMVMSPASWPGFDHPGMVSVIVILMAFVTFLTTLPSEYNRHKLRALSEDSWTDADRKDPDRSGLTLFRKGRKVSGKLWMVNSVQVVVLGDIGRSPRMQYHALSIAACGGEVNLIGYRDSEIHPDILANRFIKISPLTPCPKVLQGGDKMTFLLKAPLKLLWQFWNLYWVLGYTPACKWMVVQNPPSIPTLLVAQAICFFRNTKLVIDWHNFGSSILALRLGSKHPLVALAGQYDHLFALRATAHLAVSDAMTRVLKEKWNFDAQTLHDRPSNIFQPLSQAKRRSYLRSSSETSSFADGLGKGTTRLLVSSTSWTADEDFSLLLEALVGYSQKALLHDRLPELLVVITGKGPQKEHYINQIQQLEKKEDKLSKVTIKTAWLSVADYASLLGSADVGISLHTSSSGVDLPMKAVDMLGTGLPVLGWSKYESWPELVHEGENGCGFSSAEGLTLLLQNLFSNGGKQLDELKKGALKDCEHRWDDEWMPVVGELLDLKK